MLLGDGTGGRSADVLTVEANAGARNGPFSAWQYFEPCTETLETTKLALVPSIAASRRPTAQRILF